MGCSLPISEEDYEVQYIQAYFQHAFQHNEIERAKLINAIKMRRSQDRIALRDMVVVVDYAACSPEVQIYAIRWTDLHETVDEGDLFFDGKNLGDGDVIVQLRVLWPPDNPSEASGIGILPPVCIPVPEEVHDM